MTTFATHDIVTHNPEYFVNKCHILYADVIFLVQYIMYADFMCIGLVCYISYANAKFVVLYILYILYADVIFVVYNTKYM